LAGPEGQKKIGHRNAPVVKTSAVIAAMNSYDTMGFTVIDRI